MTGTNLMPTRMTTQKTARQSEGLLIPHNSMADDCNLEFPMSLSERDQDTERPSLGIDLQIIKKKHSDIIVEIASKL